jgi:hypothetical protein
MLSKCANPACSEEFLYLHQGKLFQLTPTPKVRAVRGATIPLLYERFWLCEKCCKQMTLVWGGAGPKLVPLPPEPVGSADAAEKSLQEKPRRRAASAGLHWR